MAPTSHHRLRRQWSHIALGVELMPIAVGLRSKIVLALLSAAMLVKPHTPWRDRPVRISVRMAGRTTDVHITGRTELEVLKEVAVDEEYALPDDLRPDVIVDLGAHVGFASLYFALIRPDARIVAVEANGELIPRIERNLAGTNATVVHAAIGGESGTRSFYRHLNSWSSSLTRRHDWQEEVRVPALTLDELRLRVGAETVDLLKMDVEGAEWELLHDGFPEAVLAMIGEVHAMPGRAPAELLERIDSEAAIRIVRQDPHTAVFWALRK
jgi:FkbM family methyltransferase